MSLYSTSSAFAKDVWLPGLNNELLQEPGTLVGWLGSYTDPNVTVDIQGRRSYLKLRVGDSLGQGTISQGGNFPTPGDTSYDEATLSLAHLSHALSFTMEEMSLLDSAEAAAVPIMAEKMTAAKEAHGAMALAVLLASLRPRVAPSLWMQRLPHRLTVTVTSGLTTLPAPVTTLCTARPVRSRSRDSPCQTSTSQPTS